MSKRDRMERKQMKEFEKELKEFELLQPFNEINEDWTKEMELSHIHAMGIAKILGSVKSTIAIPLWLIFFAICLS